MCKMISRPTCSANKKDLVSDPLRTQEQCGRETEFNVKHNDQQGIHADMQRMQSPIFNIHIHVPAYQGDNLKMYLPRIQPVIHLHFDELARQLGINREEQNQEATYRAFSKLLSMTSPKFGDVKFHYQENPNGTVNKNKEFARTGPRFSLNYSNDKEAQVSADSERLENGIPGNCEMPDCYGYEDSSEDSNDIPENNLNESDSNSEQTLWQKFNLKEAVVVLEDVCKTKYFKNMVAAGYIRDPTLQSESECDDFLRKVEGLIGQENRSTESTDYRSCCVKREIESCSPEARSPRGRTICKNININPLNSSYQMQHKLAGPSTRSALRSSQNSVGISVRESSERTLHALAEGCKFSDILSRFQIKQDEDFIEDSVKYSEEKTQWEEKRSNKRYNYESDERIQEHSLCHGPIGRRSCFNEREGINRSQSYSCVNDFGNYRDSFVKMNAPGRSNDVDCEVTSLKSPLNEEDLDGMAWTPEEATQMSDSRLDIISPVYPTLHKSVSVLSDNRENKFDNLGISGFQPGVLEEEMGRSNNGRTGRNLKKKATEIESSLSKESAPAKKMKTSDEKSKKTTTSSGMEEYIPLQASGATKFAVAPLNKVNPYKSHDARNFKTDMLYGKRINRFSSSDHLRIYQLKQKAAKTQSD